MKRLNGLAFVERAVSHMGALDGCLKHLGIAVSPGWLYGSTGHAFIVNVGSDLCGSGPHCWDWATVNRLGARAIGYRALQVYTNGHDPEREQKQRAAWQMVKRSIDAGHPCYGWHYEFMVICGYDESGYLLSGPAVKAPGDWTKFGMDAVGFMDVWSIEPGARGEDSAAIAGALEFAVAYARSREGTAGLAAYDPWIEGVGSGKGDPFGAAYHAGIWAECRRFAVQFLEEADQRTGGSITTRFAPAIALYRDLSRHLDEVERLFPYRGHTMPDWAAFMADDARRKQAVKHLRVAKGIEPAAVNALDAIVGAMKAHA